MTHDLPMDLRRKKENMPAANVDLQTIHMSKIVYMSWFMISLVFQSNIYFTFNEGGDIITVRFCDTANQL